MPNTLKGAAWRRGSEPRRRTLGLRVVALASVAVLSLTAACGGSSSSDGAAPSEAKNQTLTVGIATMQQQYADPVLANEGGNTYPIKWSVGEPLVRWDLKMAKVPGLATKWEVSEDGLTWTINLRTGVKLHDGSDFTAQDIATSIERVKNPDFTSYASYSAKIAKVDVVDNATIKITTKVPYANLVFDTPPPTATAYWKKVGEAEFRKKPMSSGPFKFVLQKLNDSMTLERFDDFWDKDRIPNFKTLVLKILPEESARIAGLQSGQLDVVHGLTPNGAKQVDGNNGIKIVKSEGSGNATIQFPDNFRPDEASPFKDVRVRKALLMAIDREAISKSLYNGFSSVSSNLTAPVTLGNDASLKAIPYDPEGAKKLLKEAGQSNLSFTYTTTNATTIISEVQKYSEAVVGYWNAIGLKVKLDVQDSPAFLDKQVKHQHVGGPIWIGSPSILISDPEKLSIFFGSEGAYSTSKDADLDAIFKTLSEALDPAEQKAAGAKLSKALYEKLYAIPTLSLDTVYAIGPKVASFDLMQGNPYGGPFWYLRAK